MAKRIRVTDHAIIRYLERVYGIDRDALAKKIARDEVRQAIGMGAERVRIDGVTYVLNPKAKTIITVMN